MAKDKIKVKSKRPKAGNQTLPGKSLQIRQDLLWLILSFVFAFLLYLPTINHGYVLDDLGVLVQNRFIRDGVSGIPSILIHSYRYGAGIEGDYIYRPLSQVMFAVEWQFLPGKAWLGHFFNVLFYALGCSMLFMVLKKYLSQVHQAVLFCIVLLFASHPVHTEVVANIKSRDEIMAFFFLMVTLWFMWKSASARWGLFTFLAGVTFFFAMMSKEGVSTMVFIFPLMLWFFTGLRGRKLFVTSLSMAVPVVAYILIRQQIFSETSDIYSLGVIDNLMVTAPDGLTRFATAVRILGKYLFYCFIPYQQVSDYSYRQLTLAGISDPYFLVSALVYTGMIIISALFFRKKDIRVFALIFYLVTISIYSNLFFLIGSAFGERFLFLPSLGICILIVMMIIGRASAESSPTQNDIGAFLLRNRIQLILIIALVVAFSVKSFYRSTEWKDSYTLFTADVQRSPNSARLHMQMGTAWRDLARKEQDPVAREALVRRALASYRRSLDLLPSFPEAQEQTGLAWYMLGQIDIAMFYYDMVVKKNPLKAELWNNIGSVWVDRGDLNQALLVFRKVTEINPAYADGWQNIGSVLGRMGRFEEAIPYFYKSIELAPDKALSYQLLSLTFQNLGRPDEAASWQQRAIEIRAAETDL